MSIFLVMQNIRGVAYPIAAYFSESKAQEHATRIGGFVDPMEIRDAP